jgi:uncharacterized protein YunC (DUF1805 family)
MPKIEKIKINGREAYGIIIETNNDHILVIKAPHGILGCGYINVDVASKFGDVVAIVRGVNTFDDMLEAVVQKTSPKARQAGIKEGMKGKEALQIMFNSADS